MKNQIPNTLMKQMIMCEATDLVWHIEVEVYQVVAPLLVLSLVLIRVHPL
jgi:hypothetical protein